MIKKLGWATLGLLLLIIFLLAWTPYGLKRYAENRYPVRIGGIALNWGRVTFSNVAVEREDIKGLLNIVEVDWHRNVQITGGTLEVDLDKFKKNESSSSKTESLEGSGLVIKVKKRDAEGTLNAARFDAKQICFDTGDLRYKGSSAEVTEGCLSRSDKKLTAKRVEIPFELPFEIPRIEKKQVLKIESVHADPRAKTVWCESASLLPFLKVKGPATASLGEDQTLLASADHIEVLHPWVAPEVVTFGHVSIRAPKSLLTGEGQLNVTSGPAEVTIEPSKFRLSGKDSCNNWIEALPTPLPEALQQAKGHFSGDLSFEVSRDPSPHFAVKESCRFQCDVDPLKSLRGGRVRYMAYDKDDKLFERTIGPGTKDWVSISSLPPHIGKAFITLEDPGFLSHRGIIPQALENSFKDNLKLGRFFRGGSTITMQLAKNLWLKRSKTIGRKAEEALLTTALESCLTKSQILELYINAVEMGPNLYGIGAASKHYFHKEAADLEPEEAFYLAAILPHPRKAVPPESGGLERVRSLMRTLGANGLLNETLVPLQVDSTGWVTD
jgi:hypothetical protein